MSSFKLNKKYQYWLDFLFLMTKKEIKAKYKRSKIGFLWAFLNPLSQMLIMGFVFQHFVKIEIDNYFLFLFVGLLPWNLLTETIPRTTATFVNERFLLKKAKFPREILILSVILANFFHTLIALLILLVYLMLSTFSWSLFVLPIYLLPLFIYLLVFIIGISFFSSTLYVKNRDIGFVVKVVLSLWFYLTPIIYTLNLIPQELHTLFYLNPMTGIVEIFRNIFFGSTIHSWSSILLMIPVVILFTGLSLIFFRKNEPYFDDYL